MDKRREAYIEVGTAYRVYPFVGSYAPGLWSWRLVKGSQVFCVGNLYKTKAGCMRGLRNALKAFGQPDFWGSAYSTPRVEFVDSVVVSQEPPKQGD